MTNLVVLQGRLTADPELKTTPNGLSVTSFSIAVDRNYQNTSERQADFINIVAWRQTAEFITKYFNKGKMIIIEGALQTRKYQDKNGNNRTVLEVVANQVQFAGDREKTSQSENTGSFSANETDFEDLGEVNDDDLPF